MQRYKRFHTISFKHAFDGLVHTFKNQPNLRVHLFIAFLVVLAGIYFELSLLEWLIISFTITWVIVAEMINTTVEAVVDLITQTKNYHAKIAKDVAAGLVLVSAIGSVVIGCLIFLPKIL